MKKIGILILVGVISSGCFGSKEEEVVDNTPLELIGDGGALAANLIDWEDEFEEEVIVPTEEEKIEATQAEIDANFALFQDRFTVDIPETEYTQINQKIKLFVTQKEDEFKRKALKEKMRVNISGAGYQYGSNYLSMSLRIKEIVYKTVPQKVTPPALSDVSSLLTAVIPKPTEKLEEKVFITIQVKTFVYDIKNEKFIEWNSVFLPDTNIFNIVTPIVKSELKGLLHKDFNEAWFDQNFGPTAGTYIAWVLDGEGIRLFFDERTLGPLSLGVSEVVIPWGTIQGYVHQGFHVMDGMAFRGVDVSVAPAIHWEASVIKPQVVSSSAPAAAISENVFTGFSMVEVANHSTGGDCWIVVNGSIYDMSSYSHENVDALNQLKSQCGANATDVYNSLEDPLPIAGYNLGPVEG